MTSRTPPLPSTQKAVIIHAPKQALLVRDAPIPRLRDGYILVRTHAVALNPTDWKHIDYLPSPGAIVGCDYAGVVEAIAPRGVTKAFAKGDRVAGFVHGSDAVEHENGAFAEYVVAKADLQLRVPERVSLEEAATLGVGVTTVGQALYQSLGLPLPTQPMEKTAEMLLVYGGSTATGTLAVQFAKLSGLTVLTTCSPRNFALVKALGATAAFDYNDPDCARKIRAYTDDKLRYAFDTISLESTVKICCDAIGSAGGKCTTLLQVKLPRDDVETGFTLGYTAIGERVVLRPAGGEAREIPPKPEDFEFAKMFWGLAEKLLSEGKFKPHPPSVRKGGLVGVLEGLQELREGKVSGEKLVYRVSETP